MTSTSATDAANNAQRQTWIAAAAVILTVIGAAWWTGRQMATREDIAELRQEMTTHRQEMSAEHTRIRQDMTAAHALIREEIASQMREIRGYINDHLDEHPLD